MKILLNVCTPVQVRKALTGHEVRTAVKMGWGELENGALILAAESAGFEVFIICDKNMRYQQSLTSRRLAILELWTNHRPTLETHWPLIAATVASMRPGEYCALEFALVLGVRPK